MGELEVANACGSPHVKIDNKREQQKRKLNSKPVNTAVGGRFIFLILALHETKNVKIDYNLVTSRHSHAKLNSLKCVLWRGKKKANETTSAILGPKCCPQVSVFLLFG